MNALSLGERLRNWFAADEPASASASAAAPRTRTAPPPAPAPMEPVAADPGGTESDRFRALQRRLRELLTQPQLLATGRVHMIDLDRVRERLGPAWPDQRQRIHALTERVIGRYLGERDVQFRAGDGEFILVFADMDKEAARLVCAKVAEELHRLFLGDPDLSEVKVATVVGTLDGRTLFERASVADLLVAAGRSAAAAGAVRATVGGAPEAAGEAAEGGEGGEPRRLHLAGRDQDRIDTMFRPVWDVGRQVISTYLCTPVRHFPDGSAVEGAAALAAVSDPQHLARLNRDALIDTAEILDELFRNKFRLMVSVPVCFETLAARRSRQDYIGLCQSVPDYLRRFITFELLRFPPGVPNGRLTELVNELRPFCRWVFLRVGLKQAGFANLAGTGLTGITVQVPPDRAAEARTMEDLNGFVAAAERAHLRTCAVGIVSTSLAVAARGAGFTFIAGDRIGQVEEIPQHMLRFGWQDLFLRGQHPHVR